MKQNEEIFDAADTLETMDYEPKMANGIIDIICRKIGLDPTEADSFSMAASTLRQDEE